MKHVTVAVVANPRLARELAQQLARYIHVVIDVGGLQTTAARRAAIGAQVVVVGPCADADAATLETLAARLYDVRLFHPGLRVLCLDDAAARAFAPAETVDAAGLRSAILADPLPPARPQGWRLFQQGTR